VIDYLPYNSKYLLRRSAVTVRASTEPGVEIVGINLQYFAQRVSSSRAQTLPGQEYILHHNKWLLAPHKYSFSMNEISMNEIEQTNQSNMD